MEAVIRNNKIPSALSLSEVAAKFFKLHSVEETNLLFLKFFQCWVLKDCKIKAEISDEEVALFFDELTDLVTATYNEYKTQKAANLKDEGKGHE